MTRIAGSVPARLASLADDVTFAPQAGGDSSAKVSWRFDILEVKKIFHF